MPDLKSTVRSSRNFAGHREGKTVTYIQNDRRRVEERLQILEPSRPGEPAVFPAIVTITRCDLGQMFVLNLDDQEYMSMPLPKFPSIEEMRAIVAQRPKTAVEPQPTLLIETTTEDTSERKELFGYTARHVIRTVKQILVESGQIQQEAVTDGWYIDLDTRISCDPFKGLTAGTTIGVGTTGRLGELPVLTYKYVGKAETGFALLTNEVQRLTHSLPDGSTQVRQYTNEMHVTELSTEPLDSALFEVPTNFREVPQIRQDLR